MNSKFQRRQLIELLGGAAAFGLLSSAQKADALEDHMMAALTEPHPQGAADNPVQNAPVANTVRRGVGRLFGNGRDTVKPLEPMPSKPTLVDFFNHRFGSTRRHCLQSAASALKAGESEERVLSCLLHDNAQPLMCVDHGYWGAQMFAPYVSEKVSWAIRYHQALRFFPDKSVGYEYPQHYVELFGANYVPEPYIRQAYEYARRHPWYMDARIITVHDIYAFDPKVHISLDPFMDIIGRHFREPEEGLGFDNTPSTHLWRSLIFADHPL